MIYLFNTAVLTSFGQFRFSGPLSVEEARVKIPNNFQSAIGHQATAILLTRLLGIPVAMHRMEATMQPGDAALVLRLKFEGRQPEGKILSVEELEAIPFELCWLERLS